MTQAQVIDASPGRVNIKGLVQGDSLQRTITIKDGDYSAYTFAAKVELNDGTTSAFTVGTPAYASPDTSVVITLPAATTATFDVGDVLDWDLQWTDPDGLVRTLARGKIRVLEQVTT